MTREQRRMVDKLYSVYWQHVGSHECSLVGEGPECADARRLWNFISDLEYDFLRAPVHCAVCGEDMEPTDRLPYVLRLAHLSCVGKEQLARTGAPRVGVAVGQRMGGGRALALAGKGAGR